MGIFNRDYDPGGFTQWEAQRYFLAAIMENHTEVLQDLKEKVLPNFVKTLPPSWMAAEHDPQHQAVKDSILTWAGKFNLREQFTLKTAIRTMESWHRAPSFAKFDPLEWSFPAKSYWPGAVVPPEEREIIINHPGWDPAATGEQWPKFEEIFMVYVKKYLEDYRRRVEQKAGESCQATPYKTRKEHFLWLAAYQVGGESLSGIAKKERYSRQNVTDRINEAAELCEIKLRPRNRPGRPKSK